MKDSLTIKRTITLLIFTLIIFSTGRLISPSSVKHKESKTICSTDISFISDNTDDIPYFIEKDSEEDNKDFQRLTSTDFFENRFFYIRTISDYKNNENLPIVILIQNTNLPPPAHS